MEQFIYETRPYAFLIASVYALANAKESQYTTLLTVSAVVLMAMSLGIIFARYKSRGQLKLHIEKGRH
jgi:hypothetical protein